MIRVVEISSDSNIGGAGKCILTFLKYFDREKFEVCVILPKGSLLKKEVEKYNIKTFELPYLAEKSLDFKAISGLRRLLKYLNPDIVHTHASMSARIAAKLCKIKVVYTRHSVFPPPASISKGLGKLINGFVNNRTADRIIAVAEAAKKNLTDTGVSPGKIEVILNGVSPLVPYDAEKLSAARRRFGLSEGENVAVMAARLNVVKGHTYFIRAAEILRDKGVDAKFLIAGTGDTEDELKAQIAAAHLEDRVKMLGFLEDVEPLMNVMTVQVNCSFGTEATSLALLEGMSLGKPAVVTNYGGNPEVIEDGKNGLLIPTHSAEALADALEKIFAKDSAELSRNCIEIYKKRFAAELNTRNIENIYASLADRGGKDGALYEG